jgi:hypothetical protein
MRSPWRPCSALPLSKARPIGKIADALGVENKWTKVKSFEELESAFKDFGPGARGVAFGDRGPGQVGHVFNVVNDHNGRVRFWDGQSMARPEINGQGYKNFLWLRTN